MGLGQLFDGLYKLFAKDFLRHPDDGSYEFSEYLDACVARCDVLQEQVGAQFNMIEEELEKEEHDVPPETIEAIKKGLMYIREDTRKAARYFEEQSQELRSRDEKSPEALLALYNFAKEQRLAFADRVKKLEDLLR